MTKDTQFSYLLVISIAVVTFLMPLDITVLAMALRVIQSDMGASFSELQWVVNIYNVVYASALPVAGVLVARFGYRACFIASCAIFGLSSVVAGAAGQTEMLIAMRLLQGGAGALVLISGITTLRDRVPPEKLGLAFGIWGSALGGGVAFGPLIGDFVVSALGWRWIFYLNFPLTILAILPFLRRSAPPTEGALSLDKLLLPGAAGCVLALMCLFADTIAGVGFSAWALLIPATVIGGCGMLTWMLRSERLPDTMGIFLLRDTGFRTGTLLGVLLGFSYWAMILYWPGFLLSQPETNSISVAPVLLALTLPLLVLPPVGAALAQRLPSGLFHGGVALAQLCGLVLVVSAQETSMLVSGLLILGIATALVNAEVTNLAIGSVPAKYAAIATSLNMTARHAALTIGIAVFGTVIANVALKSLPSGDAASAAQSAKIVTKLVVGDVESAQTLAAGLESQLGPEALYGAIAHGFDAAIAIALVATLLAALLAFVMLPLRSRGAERRTVVEEVDTTS